MDLFYIHTSYRLLGMDHNNYLHIRHTLEPLYLENKLTFNVNGSHL